MADNQEAEFERLNIDFKSLWGRRLQLIDCQNLFCEISKYARVAHPEVSGVSGRTRIKQKFTKTGRLEMPWYPPKWGINDRITASFSAYSTASTEDKKENKAGPIFQTRLDEN